MLICATAVQGRCAMICSGCVIDHSSRAAYETVSDVMITMLTMLLMPCCYRYCSGDTAWAGLRSLTDGPASPSRAATRGHCRPYFRKRARGGWEAARAWCRIAGLVIVKQHDCGILDVLSLKFRATADSLAPTKA